MWLAGPHWWQVVWGRTHSSVSLTSSSCLVGCCLQSCQIPKMSLLAPRPVLQAIGAQPQWVFMNTATREPCKINGWFPGHQCKWGAGNHLNIVHSHRCDRAQFYLARARHMVALVSTLVSTHRQARLSMLSAFHLFTLWKKTKQNKTNAANIVFPPRGRFKPPLPAAKLFVLYLRSEISLVS